MESANRQENGPQLYPLRLTKRTVTLVVLIFLAVDTIPGYLFMLLHDWFGPTGRVVQDEAYWELIRAASPVLRKLHLFDARAALVASALLYFGIVRTAGWKERRLARGEIFTGILNLHIAVVAIAALFVQVPAESVTVMKIASGLAYLLIMTAAWCLIGFHLCEGRLLAPLVGLFIGGLAHRMVSWCCAGDEWRYFRLFAFSVTGLLNFGWQLWLLVRKGSGFELFPTGLLRPLRRCAKVFLSIAACFWILDGKCFEFFHGEKDLRLLEFLGSSVFPFGRSVGPIVAYVVPLVFLLWPKDEFDRKSRGLTLVLFGVCMAVGVILYPIIGANQIDMLLSAEPVEPIPSLTALAELPESFLVLLGLLFSPAWGVLVFLALLRWWVRGRFGVPLLVPVLGYGVFLAGMILPWPWPEAGYKLPAILADRFVWARIAGQVVMIVLSLVLLFKNPADGEGTGKIPPIPPYEGGQRGI